MPRYEMLHHVGPTWLIALKLLFLPISPSATASLIEIVSLGAPGGGGCGDREASLQHSCCPAAEPRRKEDPALPIL